MNLRRELYIECTLARVTYNKPEVVNLIWGLTPTVIRRGIRPEKFVGPRKNHFAGPFLYEHTSLTFLFLLIYYSGAS